MESEVHAHYPEVVAVKVASQNLPTSGAQASAASPRKTVPERYDELASKMTQYEAELQTSAVTSKTVKEDAKNLLRWLVEIKKQLEGLRPLQEDVDMLQSKVLQFKVHIIVLQKLHSCSLSSSLLENLFAMYTLCRTTLSIAHVTVETTIIT